MENSKRQREKEKQKNTERGTEMLSDKARGKNIHLKDEKSIHCSSDMYCHQIRIALGHRIQGGSPAAFLNKYAVGDNIHDPH